jgi:multiple sugar transport system ATP-binding protein
MTMADKIVLMHDGMVEQVGPPLELYDRPRNLTVAGFIGSPAMNFLPGTLAGDGGAPVVETADGFRLPVPGNVSGAPGRRVIYGVRPEHLELAPNGAAPLPLKVSVVEPTGAETQVVCHIGDGEISAVFKERHDFRPGQGIGLKPILANVHLFDADTGRRL